MDGFGGLLSYSDFDTSSSESEMEASQKSKINSDSNSRERDHEYPEMLDNYNYTNYTYDNYSDYRNETYEDMYSTGFKVAIAVLYNSVFVTALLGNALVCYVVFSSPRMRTVTNYLIANLAFSDLLMALLCVPFSYIPVLLQYWPFGHFLCYLLPPAQGISVLVSSYTLIVLAVDRYIAIIFPLRPRFRRSQATWVILLVWFIAIITAAPIAIFTEYYQNNITGQYFCEETGWKRMGVEEFKLPYGITMMILQYFFPLIVLIFTYSRIAMAVWGNRSLGEAEDSRDQRLARTKRKTVTMSLTVVAGYTLAWLPFNILVLVGPERITWYPQYVFFACHSLAMAHTCFNFFIYTWLNVRFRTAFISVLSRLHLLCPCLVDHCLARTSSSSPCTNVSQYPYNTNGHSIYLRQQIHGPNSNKQKQPLLEKNVDNKKLSKVPGESLDSPLSTYNNKKPKQNPYRLTNGSVKSNDTSMDSDPPVLITIHHGASTPSNLNGTNKKEKPLKTETSPQQDAESQKKNDQLSPKTVDILTTAKDADLIEDEDESETESPVWT